MFESGFGQRSVGLYAIALIVVQVGLFVDEVDAEEIVDEVELLLVPHAIQLAGHFVVF